MPELTPEPVKAASPVRFHTLNLASLQPRMARQRDTKTMEELGRIMLESCGREACALSYKINADDVAEVGRQALAFGDINKDGTLN